MPVQTSDTTMNFPEARTVQSLQAVAEWSRAMKYAGREHKSAADRQTQKEV